jgi:hypothetical protein
MAVVQNRARKHQTSDTPHYGSLDLADTSTTNQRLLLAMRKDNFGNAPLQVRLKTWL